MFERLVPRQPTDLHPPHLKGNGTHPAILDCRIQWSQPGATVKRQKHSFPVWQWQSPWHPETRLPKEQDKVHVGVSAVL